MASAVGGWAIEHRDGIGCELKKFRSYWNALGQRMVECSCRARFESKSSAMCGVAILDQEEIWL